ncbi:hypothetical protein ACJJTC_018227 [Scirpophaga incertulas]
MGKSPDKCIKKMKKRLERLERKLQKKSRHTTRSPERRRSRTRSRSPIRNPTEEYQSISTSPDRVQEFENTLAIDLTSDDTKVITEDVDSEVLALLGNYPQEEKYGPDLLPSIVTRWEAIIKKGLDKEERKDLLKKYPPPLNFKILNAPKLNPEARAAAGENVLKRDKAIEAKQQQISCAISALGCALNNMCKSAVDKDNIALISDAARLLCDYHHTESLTRKNFILTGLDKSTKESVKDTRIDEWLFGADFADKLKASKAINRSGQDLKGKQPQTQNNNQQNRHHLNFRGTTNNYFKTKTQKTHSRVTARKGINQYKYTQSVNTQQTNYNRQQQQNQHRRR